MSPALWNPTSLGAMGSTSQQDDFEPPMRTMPAGTSSYSPVFYPRLPDVEPPMGKKLRGMGFLPWQHPGSTGKVSEGKGFFC